MFKDFEIRKIYICNSYIFFPPFLGNSAIIENKYNENFIIITALNRLFKSKPCPKSALKSVYL